MKVGRYRYMTEQKVACVTLDLENDWYFDKPGYDHLTFNYIDEYIDLISDVNIPVTFFAVGRTIERFPGVIDKLYNNLNCEFHLHSYQHDTSKSYDFRTEIRNGLNAFENQFGHPPIGYRAPQGNIEQGEFDILEEEGFRFDSSIFPSYRPGVYNNLNTPTVPHKLSSTRNLVEIPISVEPLFRIPIAHSYLKLFGKPFLKYLEHSPLSSKLVYNTHLQDLYWTDSHTMLSQPKRAIFARNMNQSIPLFRAFIGQLRDTNYQFAKMTDLYKMTKVQSNSPNSLTQDTYFNVHD
jgi:peptidoglycan/xylan/chitin deacetylase (PgdA/CDA1 family)